jgi:hypothetical protein
MRYSCQNDDRKKFVRFFGNGKPENGTKIEKNINVFRERDFPPILFANICF